MTAMIRLRIGGAVHPAPRRDGRKGRAGAITAQRDTGILLREEPKAGKIPVDGAASEAPNRQTGRGPVNR